MRWTCDVCTRDNAADARACATCDATSPALLAAIAGDGGDDAGAKRRWACAACTVENEGGADECNVCGTLRGGRKAARIELSAADERDGVLDALVEVARAAGGRVASGDVRRTLRTCARSLRFHAQSDDTYTCGYRNLQMLLSSLPLRSPAWRGVARRLLPAAAADASADGIPTVRDLQVALEHAWRDGFDVEGSRQLNEHVVGTRKWIGATEVATILRWAGVRAEIVDFPVAHGPDGIHPALFTFVADYFGVAATASPAASASPTGDAFQRLMRTPGRAAGARPLRPLPPAPHAVAATDSGRAAVFLQHAGHSRIIVGVDHRAGEDVHLLVLDPATAATRLAALSARPVPIVQRTGQPPTTLLRGFRLPVAALKHRQYQLVMVHGLYASERERLAGRRLSSIQL